MDSHSRDPFYDVKDRVEASVTKLEREVPSWENLSPTSPQFRPLTKSIAKEVSDMKKDLKDLATTIQIVQENRKKFAMIDDRELESRVEFVKEAGGKLFGYELKLSKAKATVQQQNKENRTKLLGKGEKGGTSGTGGGTGSSRFSSAAVTEGNRANDEYINDVRNQQQAVEEKQDLVLEDMSAALSRLSNLADDINTELKVHETMLNDVDDEMGAAQDNMNMVMKKLEKLLKSSDKGRLCCIAILFFTAIALLLAIVYGN